MNFAADAERILAALDGSLTSPKRPPPSLPDKREHKVSSSHSGSSNRGRRVTTIATGRRGDGGDDDATTTRHIVVSPPTTRYYASSARRAQRIAAAERVVRVGLRSPPEGDEEKHNRLHCCVCNEDETPSKHHKETGHFPVAPNDIRAFMDRPGSANEKWESMLRRTSDVSIVVAARSQSSPSHSHHRRRQQESREEMVERELMEERSRQQRREKWRMATAPLSSEEYSQMLGTDNEKLKAKLLHDGERALSHSPDPKRGQSITVVDVTSPPNSYYPYQRESFFAESSPPSLQRELQLRNASPTRFYSIYAPPPLPQPPSQAESTMNNASSHKVAMCDSATDAAPLVISPPTARVAVPPKPDTEDIAIEALVEDINKTCREKMRSSAAQTRIATATSVGVTADMMSQSEFDSQSASKIYAVNTSDGDVQCDLLTPQRDGGGRFNNEALEAKFQQLAADRDHLIISSGQKRTGGRSGDNNNNNNNQQQQKPLVFDLGPPNRQQPPSVPPIGASRTTISTEPFAEEENISPIHRNRNHVGQAPAAVGESEIGDDSPFISIAPESELKKKRPVNQPQQHIVKRAIYQLDDGAGGGIDEEEEMRRRQQQQAIARNRQIKSPPRDDDADGVSKKVEDGKRQQQFTTTNNNITKKKDDDRNEEHLAAVHALAAKRQQHQQNSTSTEQPSQQQPQQQQEPTPKNDSDLFTELDEVLYKEHYQQQANRLVHEEEDRAAQEHALDVSPEAGFSPQFSNNNEQQRGRSLGGTDDNGATPPGDAKKKQQGGDSVLQAQIDKLIAHFDSSSDPTNRSLDFENVVSPPVVDLRARAASQQRIFDANLNEIAHTESEFRRSLLRDEIRLWVELMGEEEMSWTIVASRVDERTLRERQFQVLRGEIEEEEGIERTLLVQKQGTEWGHLHSAVEKMLKEVIIQLEESAVRSHRIAFEMRRIEEGEKEWRESLAKAEASAWSQLLLAEECNLIRLVDEQNDRERYSIEEQERRSKSIELENERWVATCSLMNELESHTRKQLLQEETNELLVLLRQLEAERVRHKEEAEAAKKTKDILAKLLESTPKPNPQKLVDPFCLAMFEEEISPSERLHRRSMTMDEAHARSSLKQQELKEREDTSRKRSKKAALSRVNLSLVSQDELEQRVDTENEEGIERNLLFGQFLKTKPTGIAKADQLTPKKLFAGGAMIISDGFDQSPYAAILVSAADGEAEDAQDLADAVKRHLKEIEKDESSRRLRIWGDELTAWVHLTSTDIPSPPHSVPATTSKHPPLPVARPPPTQISPQRFLDQVDKSGDSNDQGEEEKMSVFDAFAAYNVACTQLTNIASRIHRRGPHAQPTLANSGNALRSVLSVAVSFSKAAHEFLVNQSPQFGDVVVSSTISDGVNDAAVVSDSLFSDLLVSLQQDAEVLRTSVASQKEVLESRLQVEKGFNGSKDDPEVQIIKAREQAALKQHNERIASVSQDLERFLQRAYFTEVCYSILHRLQGIFTNGFLHREKAMPLLMEVIALVAKNPLQVQFSSESKFQGVPTAAYLHSGVVRSVSDIHAIRSSYREKSARLKQDMSAPSFPRIWLMDTVDHATALNLPRTVTGDPVEPLRRECEGKNALVRVLRETSRLSPEQVAKIAELDEFKSISDAKHDAFIDLLELAQSVDSLVEELLALETQRMSMQQIVRSFEHSADANISDFESSFREETESLRKKLEHNERYVAQHERMFQLVLAEVDMLRRLDQVVIDIPPKIVQIPVVNEANNEDDEDQEDQEDGNDRQDSSFNRPPKQPKKGELIIPSIEEQKKRYTAVAEAAAVNNKMVRAGLLLLGNLRSHEESAKQELLQDRTIASNTPDFAFGEMLKHVLLIQQELVAALRREEMKIEAMEHSFNRSYTQRVGELVANESFIAGDDIARLHNRHTPLNKHKNAIEEDYARYVTAPTTEGANVLLFGPQSMPVPSLQAHMFLSNVRMLMSPGVMVYLSEQQQSPQSSAVKRYTMRLSRDASSLTLTPQVHHSRSSSADTITLPIADLDIVTKGRQMQLGASAVQTMCLHFSTGAVWNVLFPSLASFNEWAEVIAVLVTNKSRLVFLHTHLVRV